MDTGAGFAGAEFSDPQSTMNRMQKQKTIAVLMIFSLVLGFQGATPLVFKLPPTDFN